MRCKIDLAGKVSDRPVNHQTVSIKSGKKFIRWVAVFAFLLSTASSTIAPGQVDDSRELLRGVIQVIKATDHPQTGKGSVVLKRHDYKGDHEMIMDFVFKDRLSRSDGFSLIDGVKGEREVCWAVGRKCSVVCNDYNAVVQVHPHRQFHRQFSYDFHPETFMVVLDDPLPEHLEALIEGPGTISTRFSNDGILHISASYKDENIHESEMISLDTTKGYRPVSWKHKMEYPKEPKRNHNKTCRIEWGQYDSTWYVKSAEFEADSWISIPQADPPVENKPYKLRIRLAVKEFHPNVEVNDSEFTLDGLHLPTDMVVLDRIAGINYKYRSGLRATESLEGPLFEAEFSKSIREEVDTKNIAERTSVIVEETEQKPTIYNPELAQESPADVSSQRGYRNVIIIIALFAGVVVVIIGVKVFRNLKVK